MCVCVYVCAHTYADKELEEYRCKLRLYFLKMIFFFLGCATQYVGS